MSKYLVVLGAPDGATNASFQPIADAMAKGFGEPVPFVVWTDSQLRSLPSPYEANRANLLTFLAPFNAKIMVPDEVFLYVVAGDDVRGPTEGSVAMNEAIASEDSLDVLRGIIYVRVVSEADAPKLPGTSAGPVYGWDSPEPPILAFQKVADANPTRLAMRQVTAIVGKPPGTSFSVPVLNQALPGQGSISTTHLAVAPQDAVAPNFMTNIAEQMAIALRDRSSGGPAIEPRPPGPVTPGKPAGAPAKKASLLTNPLVLGALGVGAYFLIFRKKRGHKGSSRRS